MTTVEVSSASGKVEIVAEVRDDLAAVHGNVTTDAEGVFHVDSAGGSVLVHVPEGSDVRIGIGSGAVATRGALGDVRVTTASGKVSVERAGSADVRSASGRVRIGECDGPCRVVVASGSVEIGRAGRLDATIKSGSLEAGPVGGGIVHMSSGKARIRATGAENLAIDAHSGKVTIELPSDVHPHCEVDVGSGSFRCESQVGTDFTLTVSALSGDVRVVVVA